MSFWDPSSIKEAVNNLPAQQRTNIEKFYDNDFDKLLEVESRLWEEYASGTDNFYYQWYLFKVSKACGGPMARGYVDIEHWDSCLGGRAVHDGRGNECPNR